MRKQIEDALEQINVLKNQADSLVKLLQEGKNKHSSFLIANMGRAAVGAEFTVETRLNNLHADFEKTTKEISSISAQFTNADSSEFAATTDPIVLLNFKAALLLLNKSIVALQSLEVIDMHSSYADINKQNLNKTTGELAVMLKEIKAASMILIHKAHSVNKSLNSSVAIDNQDNSKQTIVAAPANPQAEIQIPQSVLASSRGVFACATSVPLSNKKDNSTPAPKATEYGTFSL